MKEQTQAQKPKFSVAIQTDTYKNLIHNTLKEPARANNFIAAVTSAVANNPQLQECEAGTILAAALLGESLQLSPSPQLGQYYMVPYEVTVKGADGKPIYLLDEHGNHQLDAKGRWARKTVKKAQFQMGYKGYIQLAVRSGYYKKLNVLEIKEGELISFDPLEEEMKVHLIQDEKIREAAATAGYYAMFEYHNGFRKAIYWNKEKMLAHADKYSPAFDAAVAVKLWNGEIAEKEMWKYSSFWYSDFDAMAKKTMLRQLISKWGIMSIEMQEVFSKDHAVIHEDGSYEYIEAAEEEADVQPMQETREEIEPAFTHQEFEELSFDDL